MKQWMRIARELILVLLLTACVLAVCVFRYLPVFGQAESYRFYLGASSSARSFASESPLIDKLMAERVAGESAEYRGDRYAELKELFRARLLFREEACGVVNYYLYSPYLGDCVYLNGYAVNLHIAVEKSGERTAAGTPLIFGGY